MTKHNNNWHIFTGDNNSKEGQKRLEELLKEPPPWRDFVNKFANQEKEDYRGSHFSIYNQEILDSVNASLLLRRPLLITGKPGTGKSSLAYAVAHELGLGKVLKWSITSRSTLTEGLYNYDAVGRLQEINYLEKFARLNPPESNTISSSNKEENQVEKEQYKPEETIGKYIRLAALGTAFATSKKKKPRVLLIDEIDKSDIDLPNDLLNLFEEGDFEIPELSRIADKKAEIEVLTDDKEKITIKSGKVSCEEFPFIILTSNGEKDFPPAFLRRVLQLHLPDPNEEQLIEIVNTHFNNLPEDKQENIQSYIEQFIEKRKNGDLANDQLLNVIYMLTRDNSPINDKEKEALIKILLEKIN